ncbi:DUF3034 family protein [Comamonadaceae bacterium G21597-S1]|nr:DUF3034 family protein [Comamonadaceae bacterium G21597-S1]
MQYSIAIIVEQQRKQAGMAHLEATNLRHTLRMIRVQTPDWGHWLHRSIALSLAAVACLAGDWVQADTGKLRLTGGVSSVEGTAGGGLTPWATIGSNATAGETGVSAYLSRVRTQDYGLTSAGVALGWNERVELSLARLDFDAAPASALNGIAPFGIAPNPHIGLNVVGLKLRLAGDAVLDSDRWWPQLSLGLQYKRVQPGSLASVLQFLGARTHGTDVYLSATKLFLADSVLMNATLRATRANQAGLLGFGSAAPGRDRYSLQPEFSIAWLLRRDLAIGAEYRFKPDNLQALGAAAGLGDALREDDWADLFIAWTPNKNTSLTLAWVRLGRVVPGVTANRRQRGLYLSGQLAF